VTTKASQPQMILIAGPYRSGTNDDPVLIKNNVQQMKLCGPENQYTDCFPFVLSIFPARTESEYVSPPSPFHSFKSKCPSAVTR